MQYRSLKRKSSFLVLPANITTTSGALSAFTRLLSSLAYSRYIAVLLVGDPDLEIYCYGHNMELPTADVLFGICVKQVINNFILVVV